MIQWNATKKEHEVIALIADRANLDDSMSLKMDLEAIHSNGCPLDFKRLLDFDEFNFQHDISGMQYNINRTNGKLTNCFIPRCAKKL